MIVLGRVSSSFVTLMMIMITSLFKSSSIGRRRSTSIFVRAFAPTSFTTNTYSTIHKNEYGHRLYMTAATAPTDTQTDMVPMTLLSGFLGSGKTTTLKHLLENNEGLRVGIIVNDVASVNIDAKLVSSSQSQEDIIELENGCACCSLADELVTSVETLLNPPGSGKKKKFDALIVELSGVADPLAIKSNWAMAKQQGLPVTKQTDVDRVITLVDACTFGTDWMTVDLAENRDTWRSELDVDDKCAGQRKVPELLAEQVEAADVIVLNKVDMATEDEVKIASSVAQGINDKAIVESVEFGKITKELILGSLEEEKKKKKKKDATEAKKSEEKSCCSSKKKEGKDPCCDEEEEKTEVSTSSCSDHSHDHVHSDACSSSTAEEESTSTSSINTNTKTSTDQLGITSFVYQRTRPFHTQRLLTLLNFWPIPIKENLEISQFETKEVPKNDNDDNEVSPFVGVLRSKGFCWMAPNKWFGTNEDSYRHDNAMYWSHAGKHLGITAAGKWWATIDKEEMKYYFTENMNEYNRILSEDFVTDEYGDRRQEIVFIGSNISQEKIEAALDHCLITDTELEYYRKDLNTFLAMTNQIAEKGNLLSDDTI